MAKIGLIGMGNMGKAILKGLLKEMQPEDMVFTAAHRETMEKVKKKTNVPFASSNAACAGEVKYLILAVKPQYFDPVFDEIRGTVRHDQVIVSLAPGASIEDLTARLGGNVRVVRAMPNTPAMLGEGMTGLALWKTGIHRGRKADDMPDLPVLRTGGAGGGASHGCGGMCQRLLSGVCLYVY